MAQMSAQPLVHRKLFTQRRSPRDLVAILRNEDHVDQQGLYDLDGSLHRGFYPPWLKAISNADLAIYLASHIPLSQLPRFLCDGVHIFLYEKKNIQDGKESERPEHIRYLVETFRRSLSALPEELIRNAADFMPKLRYPHAKEALDKIGARGNIISCGFYPVASAYGRAFGIPRVYANPLLGFDPKQHGEIYGAVDKARIARKINGERYIVIGDTADDMGMGLTARVKNPESVIIALHGRCTYLAAEADIIASCWEDIHALLDAY